MTNLFRNLWDAGYRQAPQHSHGMPGSLWFPKDKDVPQPPGNHCVMVRGDHIRVFTVRAGHSIDTVASFETVPEFIQWCKVQNKE